MMKKNSPMYLKCFLVVLPIFCFAIIGAAQLPKDFKSSYDKFKDQTTIVRKSSIVKAVKGTKVPVGAIYFYPFLRYPGQSLQVDVQDFGFVFKAVSIWCRPTCFQGDSGLIVMADGERINLGDGVRDASADSELMSYSVFRKDLEKITAAKVVEFQLGNFEGKFAPNDYNAVKTILELGTMKK